MEHKDFTETIVNLETGETTVRDYTEAEITQVMSERAETEAKTAAQLAKATEKAALLSKLGITEDEARLLLS